MAKEILYRIEFEGAEQQLNNLDKIAEELARIRIEQNKLNTDDKKSAEQKQREAELLKAMAQERQQAMARERRDILLQQKEYKAQAGTLAQLRVQAQRLGRQLETTWKVGSPEFKKAAGELDLLNRKIREADKSSGNFKSNIGNYAGSIGDAFQGVGLNVGKLTGTLGAATAATGPLGIGLAVLAGGANVLSGAFTATDTISDKFAITMAKAKAATSVFFKAIAEGDFSNFLTNIREAIAEGERYAKVLDYLEDATRGASISEAKYRKEVAQLMIDMRDVTKSQQERIKAVERIVEIETKIGEERLALAKKEVDNELKNKSVINQINKDKLRDLIENYAAYEKQFEFVEKLQDAEKRLREEKAKSGGGASGFEVADQKEVARLTKLVDGLRKATAGYSQEIIAFGKVNSEERQKIADALIKQYEAEAYATDKTRESQTMRARLIAEAFKQQEKGTAASIKNVDNVIKSLEKLRDEAIKADQQLIKLASTLAGGTLRNIKDLKAGKQFVKKATAGGISVADAGLTPELRKSGLKVDIGEEEEIFQVDAAISGAAQFVDIWANAYNDREAALRESLERGLITEQQYQKETEKLQKKQANIQRIVAISQLTADFARTLSALGLGAANTAKVGFPQNIPLLIAFAAQAAGIISNLKGIKFEKGGMINVGGNSHAQGGTKFVGSDGSAFEAERDEVLAIVNKHDSKTLKSLSDINSRHGRSFYGQPSWNYFASGGIYQPNPNIGNSDPGKLIRDIVSQVGNIPVTVSLNEIESKSQLKRKVNVIGSL